MPRHIEIGHWRENNDEYYTINTGHVRWLPCDTFTPEMVICNLFIVCLYH